MLDSVQTAINLRLITKGADMKSLAEWLGQHVTQDKTVGARLYRVAFHLVVVKFTHNLKACLKGIAREITLH